MQGPIKIVDVFDNWFGDIKANFNRIPSSGGFNALKNF